MVMQQQSEEAWFRREAEAEAAGEVRAAQPQSGVPRAPLDDGQLLNQAERVVVVAHTAELRLTEAEVRSAEGVQADAPVGQVAATVVLLMGVARGSIFLNVPPKSEPIHVLKGRAEFGRSLKRIYA